MHSFAPNKSKDTLLKNLLYSTSDEGTKGKVMFYYIDIQFAKNIKFIFLKNCKGIFFVIKFIKFKEQKGFCYEK